jgi:histidyl-tRNA synthetase
VDFNPPRGTVDFVPPRSAALRAVTQSAHRVAGLFGFAYVETPGFEPTEIFARSSGESSDVVQEEMYTFEDRGGRMLTLRPEGTAPIVRAYLANRQELPVPFKAYLLGPMWRYGRPQTGRSREFRQFDVEIIGAGDPGADVEVVACGERYFRDLGLEGYHLEVNSIGDERCRPRYRQMLLEYLEAQAPRLRDEHKDRFRENPLRVLDCKDPACREVAEDAPKIIDELCEPCREHFEAVVSGLDEEGIKHQLVPTLVRGLDYYTRTAFEWIGAALPEGQASLGGGGRYDGLAEVLGGPPTPGVGFALGIEPRILLALEAEGRLPTSSGVDCFVVSVGPEATARGRDLIRTLRGAGVSADGSVGDRPLKAQLRMADRAGARFALILGEQEARAGTVTVRRLEDGHQETVPSTDVATWISQQA